MKGALPWGIKYASMLLIVALAGLCIFWKTPRLQASDRAPLTGHVKSAGGEALAGIPIRAHLDNSNMTVSVYTNGRGEYSYSNLAPGSYSVAIKMAGFEPVRRSAVQISAGEPTLLDFSLQSRQPSISDASTAEIVSALPGSDRDKLSLSQCGNCHSLQFALKTPRDKKAWVEIVRKMTMMGATGEVEEGAGSRADRAEWYKTGTKFFGSNQFSEPLAEYLATIRGPNSGEVPFKVFPRPTADASTRLVVTEYEIPRAGESTMIRGDVRGAWPHDVLVDPNGSYVWYTDHFADVLGRLDKKTGEIKEFPYAHVKQGKRAGSHQLIFDHNGNVLLGAGWQSSTVRFDPKTEQFTSWPIGSNMLEVDPAGNIFSTSSCCLTRLDPDSGKVSKYPFPTDDGTYGLGADSQGRVYYSIFHGGRVGRFDPRTEKITEFPTPTPASGPRRGEMDARDRYWFAEYFAGRIAVLDPKADAIKEWPLIPGIAPFAAPFPAPYTVAVDNRNNMIWTTDFNANRVYRFDVKTEKFTEFLMPEPDVEIRDLMIDNSTDPATLWIPDYRPPGKIVKLQAW